MPADRVGQGLEHRRRLADPVGESRSAEIDAVAVVDLALPIERKMVGELADEDMRQQARARPAALDRARREWRLDEPLVPRARQARPHDAVHDAVHNDEPLCAIGSRTMASARDMLEFLGDVLAEPAERPATARAAFLARGEGPHGCQGRAVGPSGNATGSSGSAVASSSMDEVYRPGDPRGNSPPNSGQRLSCLQRPPGPLRHPPVDPFEQHRELRRCQRHLALLCRGPDETPSFQPLGELPLERHWSERQWRRRRPGRPARDAGRDGRAAHPGRKGLPTPATRRPPATGLTCAEAGGREAGLGDWLGRPYLGPGLCDRNRTSGRRSCAPDGCDNDCR